MTMWVITMSWDAVEAALEDAFVLAVLIAALASSAGLAFQEAARKNCSNKGRLSAENAVAWPLTSS